MCGMENKMELSNEKFCSLDMLAEVASATLLNDPSLVPDLRLQKCKNRKIETSLSRKSLNSYEKLSLDQIKSLSEKNLIEMFSEHLCDEIKKNYSFQCYLIPEQCSQIFKSFGNEIRARYKMKAHLLSHIKDLVTAANAKNNHEIFMAEPLHARKKRLKEFNQKTTRKKKVNKSKLKKDDNLELFTRSVESFNLANYQHLNAMIDDNGIIPISGMKYSHLNSGIKGCVTEHANDSSINQSTNIIKYSPYFPHSDVVCDSSDKRVIKSQSSFDNFNITLSKSNVKRKKMKPQCNTNTVSIFESESKYTQNNSHLSCDVQPESSLPVHHDHTYTSINGKTLNFELSPDRSVKISWDPSHPKIISHHHCLKKESPLIIPTPPFPFVYIPVLPHIAVIQEIGFNTNCNKCTNDDCEDLQESSNCIAHVPLLLPKHYEQSKNPLGESCTESNIDPENHENASSDVYLKDATEDSDESIIKFPNAPFCIDELLRSECPENVRAVEKKLAIKCIKTLCTKKIEAQGPLTCQICKNKSFTAQSTLMYHYQSHAGIKPYFCSVCDATFTCQHSLNYHMSIHNNKRRFVCPECGRKFRHTSNYKEHLRHHTGKTPYICADCNLR